MKIIRNILFAILCLVTFGIVFSVATYLTIMEGVRATYSGLKSDDSKIRIIQNLRFNDAEGCGYDLYLPIDKEQGPHPLILYIHGGSFIGGDKSEGAPWCKYFANKGYVGASVNYTLHSPRRASNINRMVDDIKNCVACIRSECERHGYTVTEMAVTGVSAGGCLAMLYAYREYAASPLPVRFVFQQTGPTDFCAEAWGAHDDSTKIAFASLMTGKKITRPMLSDGEYEKLIGEISPARQITIGSVPTICAYGPNDKIVPTEQKQRLFDALDSCGVTYRYIEFPHSGHALANDPDSMAAFIRCADDYCKRYLKNSGASK